MQVLHSHLSVQRALQSSASSTRVSSSSRSREIPPASCHGGAHCRVYTISAAHRDQKQLRRISTGSKSTQKSLPKSGVWRFFNLEVPAELDPGKDDYSISEPLLDAIASLLGCSVHNLPLSAFSVVRKSFDARKVVNKITKGPRFVYTVDLPTEKIDAASCKVHNLLQNRPGKLEYLSDDANASDITALINGSKIAYESSTPTSSQDKYSAARNAKPLIRARITVVGSGPAGLFGALVLAESGAEVTLLERGQPVETRGRDIGQLMVRRIVHPDSNFCFGEGGAGTWSDGKLTTRIGRNSEIVRTVLATLVKFGAPPTILMDGKPHIGTDKLVHILRKVRSYLQSLGVRVRFGTKMVDFIVRGNRISGVNVRSSESSACEEVISDAVVLAVGHSARDVYCKLLEHSIRLSSKDFAVGFRVEHPQDLINEIQILCSTRSGHQRCKEVLEKYQ